MRFSFVSLGALNVTTASVVELSCTAGPPVCRQA